jgi:FkbM family methyltransferase
MVNKLKLYAKWQIVNAAESFTLFFVKLFRLDTQKIYYECNGILKHLSHESGELWFITHILPRLLSDISEPVFLDIGANVGEYSIALAESLPSCRCYAIEPNPTTFEQLVADTRLISNIKPVNCGVGSERKEIKLYFYSSNSTTGHASLYKNAFKHTYSQDDANIDSATVTIERIDDLIDSRIIPETVIHFVKIDTEGHELEGLKGSLNTIKNRDVRVVQFEFNEMNVFSRVFLKDFYDLLGENWAFFRLDTQKLISLGNRYDSANEIFKFQNLIAIRNEHLSALFK